MPKSTKLEEYYRSHDIDIKELKHFLPYRFVRLNPRFDAEDTLAQLRSELPPKSDFPIPVSWIDQKWEFYALPHNFGLAESPCFQSGRVYGQDVSSGAAVAALLVGNNNSCSNQKPVRVLDLCCSPGLKLCALADQAPTGSTIVGVDVSEDRQRLTQRILEKYQVENRSNNDKTNLIRLYLGDGRTFGNGPPSNQNLVWDSNVAYEEHSSRGKRKRLNKSARARQRKRLRQIVSLEEKDQDKSNNEFCLPPFDLVLVDVECTTDGSLKHIQKMVESSQDIESLDLPRLTDPDQLAELVRLQKDLIASGFRLLANGGSMVYSTCSLCHDQNEDVVKWLLDNYGDAELVPVSFGLNHDLMKEGSLSGTIRFLPNTRPADDQNTCLFGGGFFLAKIRKKMSVK